MYDFIDDSFNRENSHENILSIQVNLNGFSFCICNADGRIVCFKHTDLKISGEQFLSRRFADWCNEEELLQLPYQQKQIVFNGPGFTLLPRDLESESLKTDIRELLLLADDEDEYAENWIEDINAKLLFTLPEGFNETVREKLGEAKIVHVVQKLISLIYNDPEENSLLLFFDNKEMLVLQKQNGILDIANAFRVNHTNDAIYYALSVAKQLKVKTKYCKVLLAGRSAVLSGLTEQLEKHFKAAEFVLPVNKYENIGETTLNEFIGLF